MIDTIAAASMLIGAFFFLAGTVALLRFPDVYTRLHGLAKVDNLGLGFTTFGLMLQAGSVAAGIKLGAIWLLVLIASAAVSYLVARRGLAHGIKAWRAGGEQS